MKLSQGAYGMLVQRYCAVLKKCRLFNVLGSAVIAGSVVLGCSDFAQASGDALTVNEDRTFTASDYYSSLIVNKGTVTVKSDGTNSVDLSMSNELKIKPLVTDSLGSITVQNGGTLQIVNDIPGDSIGTRINAGNVTVYNGTLASSSNFHVGIIGDGEHTPDHGFRIYSLTVDGGRVNIDNKLGIMTKGKIILQNGKMYVKAFKTKMKN